MIQAKEIRLGNIYHRKHGKGWTETVIDETILGKIFSNDPEYALNDFEPVIITEEILKRFGFTLRCIQDSFHVQFNLRTITKYYETIDLDNDPGYMEVWITTNSKDSNVGINCKQKSNIVHLHILQNLYYLLNGIELTQDL